MRTTEAWTRENRSKNHLSWNFIWSLNACVLWWLRQFPHPRVITEISVLTLLNFPNLLQSCCSVDQSRPTLCHMDCSVPDSSVLHCLPEFAQIPVHRITDAIWSSHPLLPLSPFAFNLSKHQGLFQWVVVMLPKATWLHTLGCLALGEWPHHYGYLGH